MVESRWRGHLIEPKGLDWIYSDTKEKVSENKNRVCAHCEKQNVVGDYDPCLGKLPGLMNACCGHGVSESAYVQFLDGFCIRGVYALKVIELLKSCPSMDKSQN